MKVLQNTKENREYIDSLPKVYLIACWAHFGIRGYAFAGTCDKDSVPYVWDYYDCNGFCDEWRKVKLTDTTTGWIYAWTISKKKAQQIADVLNAMEKELTV